jgi:hypothetical protein
VQEMLPATPSARIVIAHFSTVPQVEVTCESGYVYDQFGCISSVYGGGYLRGEHVRYAVQGVMGLVAEENQTLFV